MKHYNTYIELHLGDNVRHLDYLKKVIDANPEFSFTHYVHKQYLKELNAQLKGYESKIILKSLENNSIPENSINGWIGDNNWYYDYEKDYPEYLYYDKMYIKWFDHLEDLYQIPNPIKTSEDFLTKCSGIEDYPHSKEYDVLLINSIPQSGQYFYEYNKFLDLTKYFVSLNYNIITTYPIRGVECTQDYNFNLIDIAQISTKTPIIIAIDTAPIHLCLNKLTLSNCKFFHVLSRKNVYSFKQTTYSSTLDSIQF